MQVFKCFLLNPEKIWRKSVLSFLRKTQKSHTLIPKMTSPTRRFGYYNYQLKAVNRLKNSFRFPETMLLAC